jgi:hypothetical protein
MERHEVFRDRDKPEAVSSHDTIIVALDQTPLQEKYQRLWCALRLLPDRQNFEGVTRGSGEALAGMVGHFRPPFFFASDSRARAVSRRMASARDGIGR